MCTVLNTSAKRGLVTPTGPLTALQSLDVHVCYSVYDLYIYNHTLQRRPWAVQPSVAAPCRLPPPAAAIGRMPLQTDKLRRFSAIKCILFYIDVALIWCACPLTHAAGHQGNGSQHQPPRSVPTHSWLNQLNPEVKKGPFSSEEDAAIMAAHAIFGNKWASIAKLLPGR